MNASSGVLPAPAPKRRTEPSIWVAPARAAMIVLATPRPRFSWPWKPTVGLVADLGDERGDPVGGLLHDQRAGRVDDVHALAAGVDHDPGLLGEHLGRLGVAHHQEADGLQAELAGQAEVLDRDVRLGAVGGDPADLAAVVLRGADVVLGADAGEHQERDLGPLRGLGRDLDQLLLGRLREAVVERRAAEAVAVGHLDHRDAGGVERLDDVVHLLRGELVPLVVRPVAQAGVGQPQVEVQVRRSAGPGAGRACSSRVSSGRLARAMFSPTRAAAAVMMSRFPAYGGR